MSNHVPQISIIYLTAGITDAIETFAAGTQGTHGELHGDDVRLLDGLGGFLRLEELSVGAGRSNALAATHVSVRLHTRLLLRSWLVIMMRDE